jgi:hypothetical protein
VNANEEIIALLKIKKNIRIECNIKNSVPSVINILYIRRRGRILEMG